MKKLVFTSVVVLLSVLLLFGCKKDDKQIINVKYTVSSHSVNNWIFYVYATNEKGENPRYSVTDGTFSQSWTGEAPAEGLSVMLSTEGADFNNNGTVTMTIEINGKQVAYSEMNKWGTIYHQF